MTRQEFEDISTWRELIDFCNDYSCSYCDDVCSEDVRDSYINYSLEYMARENNWTNLRDTLNDIPTGYDYYRKNDYGDWYGLDDNDLEDYKSDIFDWADENGIFDDDEEDGEEPWYVDDEEFTPPKESISITDLIKSCNSKLQKINDDAEREAEEDKKAFRAFVGEVEVTGTMTVTEISINDYDLPNF